MVEGGEAVVDGFANLGTGLTNLWTIMRSALLHITQNTYLSILLVSALVYIAFRLIKKAKKAARS